jgi:gliding motility-associated lipoprotein GldH
MKTKRFYIVAVVFCLSLLGCQQHTEDKELLRREFYNTVWERFDYVRNDIEITTTTTYDLSMQISFTDDYPYDDFSMIFTVFDGKGNPYRSKGYKFNLKDSEGNWNAEKKDNCYTFNLPLNKSLTISDPGKYQFTIEQRMPITPVVGVKELVLINN